ncbi:MAG: hypothetical protein ACJ788_04160 [Ktedonobacteraceae bacterium]
MEHLDKRWYNKSVFYGLPSYSMRVIGQRLVASGSAVLSYRRDLQRRGSSPGLVGEFIAESNDEVSRLVEGRALLLVHQSDCWPL